MRSVIVLLLTFFTAVSSGSLTSVAPYGHHGFYVLTSDLFLPRPLFLFALSVVWHGPLGALKHMHDQNINNLGSDLHNYLRWW